MDAQAKAAAKASIGALANNFKRDLQRIGGLMPDAGSGAAGHSMASREFSLSATKIDEAVMWAKAGIDKA